MQKYEEKTHFTTQIKPLCIISSIFKHTTSLYIEAAICFLGKGDFQDNFVQLSVMHFEIFHDNMHSQSKHYSNIFHFGFYLSLPL